MDHHEATLDRWSARMRADPGVVGVVLGGSVARGLERADSDIDTFLVCTAARFAAAEARQRLIYIDTEDVTYDGGYVDVKVIDEAYLRAAAERADDPTRSAFRGVRLVWSRSPGLADLLTAVSTVPAEAWSERVASSMAQARLYGGYFLRQGVELDNTFLARHAAVHLVLHAGRALLAHHRVLFGGPKYLSAQVAALDRPADYDPLVTRLLADPTIEDGDALQESLVEFLAFTPSSADSLSRFVADNELGWLYGPQPPEFR